MNHAFVPSVSGDKCVKCKQPMIAHTDSAVCDSCGSIGIVELVFGNLLLCEICQVKEKQAEIEKMKPENVQARLDEVNKREIEHKQSLLNRATSIDASIKIRTDIFNAQTVSIVELKSIIDNDASIANKPYELAIRLQHRHKYFQEVIFDLSNQLVEANTNQKAIQAYMNEHANRLRAEEREKLRIADINYQPKPVKLDSTKPKQVGSGIKKVKQEELRKWAAELGVQEYMLQMISVQKGIPIEAAAKLLKATLDAAKQG